MTSVSSHLLQCQHKSHIRPKTAPVGLPQAKADSFAIRFGKAEEAPPAPTPEMAEFIDLAKYTVFEQRHAGWVLANALKEHLLTKQIEYPMDGSFVGNPKIVEIGCSSGTSTLPLVKGLRQRDAIRMQDGKSEFEGYDALDIDHKAIDYLQKALAAECTQAPDGTNGHKVRAMVADAMRFVPEDNTPYTHAVMQFSLSHFDAKGKAYLLDHLNKIMSLSPGIIPSYVGWNNPNKRMDMTRKTGFILITDEFLPKYHDAKSEQEALWKHHGAVIYDALVKGNVELAELELEACYSGMHKTGDFKISCEEFEDLLWRKGFSFTKFKTFPLVGDLVPYSPTFPSPKGMSPAERKANTLWASHNRELFNLVRKLTPSESNRQLPQAPRKKLHELAQLFHDQKLDQLRPTLSRDAVEIVEGDADQLEKVAKQEGSEDQWGVYTYKIAECLNSGLRHAKKVASDAVGNAKTLEDATRRLITLLKADERENDHTTLPCLLEWITKDPTDQWLWARGKDLPGYWELKKKPSLKGQWGKDVSFMKSAIKAALAQYRKVKSV